MSYFFIFLAGIANMVTLNLIISGRVDLAAIFAIGGALCWIGVGLVLQNQENKVYNLEYKIKQLDERIRGNDALLKEYHDVLFHHIFGNKAEMMYEAGYAMEDVYAEEEISGHIW